jgi:hypothetical protein
LVGGWEIFRPEPLTSADDGRRPRHRTLMTNQLLYSANPWIKYLIQEEYRRGLHYVWCSEQCDSSAAHPLSFASLVPVSSNPKDIYRDLHARNTAGLDKIEHIKAMYTTLSLDWVNAHEMTSDDRDDLISFITKAGPTHWKPLLYVIPKHTLGSRAIRVNHAARAGHGNEWTIADLRSTEFDIVEL